MMVSGPPGWLTAYARSGRSPHRSPTVALLVTIGRHICRLSKVPGPDCRRPVYAGSLAAWRSCSCKLLDGHAQHVMK